MCFHLPFGAVVDATAGETLDMGVQRMAQAVVIPYTWGSLLDKFQGSWENTKTSQEYFSILGEAFPDQVYYFGPVTNATHT